MSRAFVFPCVVFVCALGAANLRCSVPWHWLYSKAKEFHSWLHVHLLYSRECLSFWIHLTSHLELHTSYTWSYWKNDSPTLAHERQIYDNMWTFALCLSFLFVLGLLDSVKSAGFKKKVKTLYEKFVSGR